MNRSYIKCVVGQLLIILLFGSICVFPQTTEFSYQGFLSNTGASANGNFDLEFRLYDALTGGTVEGTNQILNVSVTNGVFSVTLDFGASAFPGADRFLEISVKPAGSGSYTLLSPRERIGRTPYAISSVSADQASFAINASNATSATTAVNSTQLGGVAANQFVQTNDPRLSDNRNPLPNSTNYIQNRTTPQTTSNFNISGTGTANIFTASTQYNLGNNRILSNAGTFNLFAGAGAGNVNTTGFANSFVGSTAGGSNTTGNANSFFGFGAGNNNTTGSDNSFFGVNAGAANTIAGGNSFFGKDSGLSNTTGDQNAFFGFEAGRTNSLGGRNTFFGYQAGRANISGSRNTFFGTEAGLNSTRQDNAFFGDKSGRLNTNGIENAFFGSGSGESNTSGDGGVFIGRSAGGNNTQGQNNTFIGRSAGLTNTTGSYNTALGSGAGVSSAALSYATAIGAGASVTSSDTVSIGRQVDEVLIPGTLRVSSDVSLEQSVFIGGRASPDAVVLNIHGKMSMEQLGSGGSVSLCRNAGLVISTCSSSLRYKNNLSPFKSGLNVVNRLQPITFNWKDGGMRDLGLGAEDVEKVEPLLVTYNDKGEVEGVKYDRIGVVLLNAVKEQQAQIEKHQLENDALKTQIEEQSTWIEEQKKKANEQQMQLDKQAAEIAELANVLKNQTKNIEPKRVEKRGKEQ
jgi:hypothetical protein